MTNDIEPNPKPLYKRSNSLLETLYFCTRSILEAEAHGADEVIMDFLKYNKYIDVSITTDLQNFLYEMGFSVSSIQTDIHAKIDICIRWHDEACILRLVKFIFDNVKIEELFK